MDEEYDAIVLGTGLKECIISGLLSVDGKKVLHMDRNSYYGGECASLNLVQLFEKFRNTNQVREDLGKSRDYSVDLVPKFIMASGQLVKILLHTDVTRYLEFRVIDGSYVARGGKVYKVPATDVEALKSSLMGFLEKRRAKKFFEYMQDYDQSNEKTWKGMNLKTTPMKEVFKYFGLDQNTVDFLGHAMALHREDSYLDRPAWETIEKMQLYGDSLARYSKSPYIYPMYGLGELPQSFARLSAIYGGTYMLNKPVEEIVYNEAGEVVGVKSEGETAKCKMVVGDPSYFKDKVKKVGDVVRCIAILNAPIPNTGGADSTQIIISQREAKRGHDIYISCVSYAHNVAAQGKYIAMVSTTAETANPESELDIGLALLGPIEEKFYEVSPMYEPLEDGTKEKVFISKSYDATSHFETTSADVLDIYKRITGEELVLKTKKDAAEGEE